MSITNSGRGPCDHTPKGVVFTLIMVFKRETLNSTTGVCVMCLSIVPPTPPCWGRVGIRWGFDQIANLMPHPGATYYY